MINFNAKVVLLSVLMSVVCFNAMAYNANIDGIYYNLSGTNAEVTFGDSNYLGIVTIPSSVTYDGVTYNVTSIGRKAFYRCNGLTSVTIPNSVTSIGDWAFSYCSGLTSISIPNSVTSIGKSAFYVCSGLTSVTIPNSVTSIGTRAFYYCSGITSVTIPNRVTSIGTRVFYRCSSLTSVTIPNSVKSIGYMAFDGCSGLTSVTIPNSVTSIGDGAFNNCSGLTSVTIPNSVTSIGNYSFKECCGLTSVTIGSGVKSIGDGAFYRCTVLLDFYLYAESVPRVGSSLFSESNIANATLHVPVGSVDTYKSTEPWSGFKEVAALSENAPKFTAIGSATVDGKGQKAVSVYTYDGKSIPSLRKSMNIIRMSNGTTKKVVVK